MPGTRLLVKEKGAFDETIQVVNEEQCELALGRRTAHALWFSEEPDESMPTDKF